MTAATDRSITVSMPAARDLTAAAVQELEEAPRWPEHEDAVVMVPLELEASLRRLANLNHFARSADV